MNTNHLGQLQYNKNNFHCYDALLKIKQNSTNELSVKMYNTYEKVLVINHKKLTFLHGDIIYSKSEVGFM